jgi:menaquinone-9 beta-reductase
MVDIAIIGAGPAGSMAGLLLARAGREVLIIEQRCFPRDKACGECISALGVEVLARQGVLRRLLDAGAVWMNRFVILSPGGRIGSASLPRPMLGLSRKVLDQVLLAAAREAGARVMQPARCESLEPALRLRNLRSNQVEMIDARTVLLADGRGALMPGRPANASDLGIKAHFTDLDSPRDAVQLLGLRLREHQGRSSLARLARPGCYGGIAPIEGGLFNIALSIPAAWLKSEPEVGAIFARLMDENPELARQVRGGRQVSAWLSGALPRQGVRAPWPPGLIPIGNAAAAIEPIGGEGMGLAMRSAELAVDALLHDQPQSRLRGAYRRLWRSRGPACRLAAVCISRPALCEVAVEMVRSWDGMRDAALRWMGKGCPEHHGAG